MHPRDLQREKGFQPSSNTERKSRQRKEAQEEEEEYRDAAEFQLDGEADRSASHRCASMTGGEDNRRSFLFSPGDPRRCSPRHFNAHQLEKKKKKNGEMLEEERKKGLDIRTNGALSSWSGEEGEKEEEERTRRNEVCRAPERKAGGEEARFGSSLGRRKDQERKKSDREGEENSRERSPEESADLEKRREKRRA